jgi:hypothetical protein
LAEILNVSADILYFHAQRVAGEVRVDADDERVMAAYRAFREILYAKTGVACEPSAQSQFAERSYANGSGESLQWTNLGPVV